MLFANRFTIVCLLVYCSFATRDLYATANPIINNDTTNNANQFDTLLPLDTEHYLITTTDYTPHQERKTYSWTGSEVTRIYNPEGYYERRKDETSITSSLNYYYRDRLGSNVAVWDATHDTLIQQTLYYPSGLPMPRCTNASAQTHKYNGKELITAEGLNESELGSRNINHYICRFTTMDKYAEKYPWQSPYQFAGNNPINYIDINGDSIKIDENDQEEFTNILIDMFGKSALFFHYTENGMVVYDEPIEQIEETEQILLTDFLSILADPNILILGVIYQNRIEEGHDYTISTVRALGDSEINGYILEPSGPSSITANINKRIPEGIYRLANHNGNTYKDTYLLYNEQVPKSRTILYHAGNTPKDTRGCQIPGKTKSHNSVYGSRKMLNEIKRYIYSYQANSVVTIINNSIK